MDRAHPERSEPLGRTLVELALLFLKLGIIGFGGPAAHIALMEKECVQRRRWLTEEEFLDLFALTQLIPGPNSTEMAIHLGKQRAGWLGLMIAGTSFILPAMILMIILAHLYMKWGKLPVTEALFYGFKPVMIAIITDALLHLARKTVSSLGTLLLFALLILASLTGVNELLLLFGSGFLCLFLKSLQQGAFPGGHLPTLLPIPLLAASAGLTPALSSFSLPLLFLTFLKIGTLLYGSGYVLLAFLRADFVTRLHWLDDTQLLEAITAGQVTPGPLFTTATFIGYLLAGGKGAVVATAGIFLPAFFFVAILSPLALRFRSSPVLRSFLQGVQIASLALMGTVVVQLGAASFPDPASLALALISFLLLTRTSLNPTWLIAAGGLFGILYHHL